MTSLITKMGLEGRKIIASVLLFAFLLTGISFPSQLYAQDLLVLPNPGTMITTTPAYVPPMLKGMRVSLEDPFAFDFILDSGNDNLDQEALKQEANKLIKYFLASLTIPEKDLWVNLSPYEKDKIITNEFGITEMGRDLLAQDYILKQLTASLIYPEKDLGKEFWNRVYVKARHLYGNKEIPVNTFNKVWILPDKAVVYQNQDTVYVLDSHLKVMLEEDYLALAKHSGTQGGQGSEHNKAHAIGSEVIREIVLPELEKEVNTGKNFAQLRQVYSSLILAKWYKQNLKASILNRAYSDQKKIAGMEVDDKTVKEKIYQQYLIAFKKGVFNYIKEDRDSITQTVIPRKYFSGGLQLRVPLEVETNPAMRTRAVPIGKLNWIKGVYHQSRGAIEGTRDAAMRAGRNSNGANNAIWFEGVNRSTLTDARRGIFGDNLENWLEMHNRNGGTVAREEAAKDLLNDEEFINRIKSIPKDDVALEIIRFAVRKNLYLGTKSFKLFLDALKQHAGPDIRKQIPNFSIPIKSFVQVIAGVAMAHDYLDNGEFKNLGREDKLAAIVGEIRRLKMELDSDNLGHIYSALPGQISANVKKEDVQKVELPMKVFDQVRAALNNEDVKRYLESDEFKNLGREDKLAAIVGEIRRLKMELDSDNLGQIYSALPGQISANVKKEDVQIVMLPMKVFDQVRAALNNEDVKRYLEPYTKPTVKKRLWAGDLLRTINRSGFSLRTNVLAFYSGLPLTLRNFIVPVKKNYHTDREGRLVIKFYRSYYRVYNFTRIPMGNGFWINRNIIPLWDRSGQIVAFEVENENHSILNINAADVIEQGMPIMQVVKQYRQEEVWQEVVAHTRQPEEVIELKDWSRRLEETIRAYNGTTTEAAVTEYIDFLVSLSELRQVGGASVDEVLQMAVADNLANVDKARDFLRYLISPSVSARGIDIKSILSEKIVNYLGDKAMTGLEENRTNDPGGIDFNLDLLELENQGRGGNFNLPNLDRSLENIHIDNGLLPVIINVTPITSLQAVLSAGRKEGSG